ncbi:DUF4913 domain-containing protein [Streptomyces acidiscabies]|uniref:DUF4913 domain-containing protein n=1 Tax=Streptomyces acidiscabies TaxID=42234 RepID=A0AAP6ELG9_9ACTN|nr:DUF4913 domain-containing protein [Streptomyces acidiscabies]MBP5936719.1 DUF4913 domain-containing protein [Streptomyces sp. LBUM 1476]MBZ3915278.1 DUF4913 domain-containing protein [Streptomyces acidiscabies]MDX2967038.1 DUF4913 domain-containing protein [Streptomyces acidiscabies]MDX3021339.1 DUF4913 domain-containing protein [Streptomyces acidiscabies]MDX3793408.1 DUF4913 domain-containing protein [Streptomyces acidiscabies]
MPDFPEGSAEPDFRLPDTDLDGLAASLRRTMTEAREQGSLLDRITSDTPTPPPPQDGEARSCFILALGGDAYAAELEALTAWVEYLLLPVYGREVSSSRPWCAQWREHPEAVARLHGLWLAWQQLTDVEAGLSGPSTWHRDHLDHVMAQLRSPDGPFAACTTSVSRIAHRLLSTPADLEPVA